MRENVKNIVDQVKSLNKPITNADRIRAMSDEELAEWFNVMNGIDKVCPDFGAHNCRESCRECWLDWLKREVSE